LSTAILTQLVAADVRFEMPPVPQWSIGRSTYGAFMTNLFAQRGTRWATRPISANEQAGLLLFRLTDSGPEPHTVQLFEAEAEGMAIGHVLVYRDARLFALFEHDLRGTDEFRAAVT
jgi:RNA polymerase sigma-70 factor (ECF subfamily)